MSTCMPAHAQHQFLVFANKTTLAVAGACGHVSAYGLLGGCAHALLSMWVHAYFFSTICNERWALISFGNICAFVGLLVNVFAFILSPFPPPDTLPYYSQTKHSPCPLSESKTIWLGLPPSIIMGVRRRNLRLARGSAESVCLHAHRCLHHAPPKPHTRPRTLSFQWLPCPGMTL